MLMLLAYGYPIGQFFLLKPHSVPAFEVTARTRRRMSVMVASRALSARQSLAADRLGHDSGGVHRVAS